jgi:hypothetical protein
MDAISRLAGLLAGEPSLPPLLLALLAEAAVLGLAERRVTPRLAARRILGPLLVMPGTVLHEIAHAAAVLLLGGRITGMSLFRVERQPDGSVVFGHVAFTGLRDPLRRSLVSVAPLLLLPPLLAGAGIALLHAASLPEALSALAAAPPATAAAWLAAALLCSRGAFPSSGDSVGAIGGACLVLLAAALAAAVTLALGPGALATGLSSLAALFAPAALAAAVLLALASALRL